MLYNAPGLLSLAPSAINGNKVTVDCSPNPLAWPIQWIGYSNDSAQPAREKEWDKCQKPVSVEESSFGKIKSIYR
jgi:hypothetical protein